MNRYGYGLTAVFLLFGCTPMGGGYGGSGGWHMGPGSMGGYGIMGILLWVIIIVGGVFLVRYLMQSRGGGLGSKPDGSAREILEQRYARGEIDREEFEAKKRDLNH